MALSLISSPISTISGKIIMLFTKFEFQRESADCFEMIYLPLGSRAYKLYLIMNCG